MKTRSYIVSAMLACVLAGGSMMGCASTQPPPGTYTPAVTKTFQADELIKALDAVVVTAKNFNATTGTLHLSDANTKLVIDSSEIVGAGLYAWGQGATTLAALKIAIDSAQLTPGRLTIARLAIDKAITDHGAGASALYIVKDVYATLRATVAVDSGKNPTLAVALDAVDAVIAVIPIQ